MTTTESKLLDKQAVEEIEARYRNATPGPWERGKDIECQGEPDNCWHTFEKQAEIFPPLGEAGPVAVASQCDFDNATFIEHAREDIPALCRTVKHLREENEQLKASATFWQAEALLEHFCSEHAKNTRQAGHYCTICAKPFVMSTPPDTRPPKYKDLQTENAELQSQLEQLRAENGRLNSERDKWKRKYENHRRE